MELSTARFLLTAAGHRLAAEVAAADPAEDDLAIATRLRASYAADEVAAAITLDRLRDQAVDKFGPDAARIFLTSQGLQQATHRVVAEHRAARIAATQPARVVDLTCGIGADLTALSRSGCRVVGVDRDPVAALLAEANLATLGLAGDVVVGPAEAYELQPVDVCFLDPARRAGGQRILNPDRYSPPWSFAESLLTRSTAVKVAPGFPHERVPPGAEAEWVSFAGQLREGVVWSGAFVDDIRRRATVLGPQGRAELTDLAVPDEVGEAPVGEFLYEPDDAVVRAHLVQAYAALVDGWLVERHLAYVSSDRLVDTRLGRAFRVVETLPYKEKALRAALRARGIGSLTIKKRGVDVTPEALRARLRLSGPHAATLVLTRTARSAQALLVDPVTTP